MIKDAIGIFQAIGIISLLVAAVCGLGWIVDYHEAKVEAKANSCQIRCGKYLGYFNDRDICVCNKTQELAQ